MPTEKVITTGSQQQSVAHNTDPNTRFAVPPERELRRSKSQSSMPSFSRTIKFTGDGAEVNHARDLSFQPPGLQWNGGPSITLT